MRLPPRGRTARRRVYGGALPAAAAPVPMAVRMEAGRARKDALARAAAALVAPGEFLFLDGGSTNLALVGHLPLHGLGIATNCVEIAADLLRRGHGGFVLLGGVVDPLLGGAVDAGALEALGRLNIDRCVLGACAVSAAAGISAHDPADAAFKRALLGASRRTIALATTEKLGGHAAHRVAPVEALECIVVEHDAPAVERSRLVEAGARLRVAEP